MPRDDNSAATPYTGTIVVLYSFELEPLEELLRGSVEGWSHDLLARIKSAKEIKALHEKDPA
jgi:hypothetical protein